MIVKVEKADSGISAPNADETAPPHRYYFFSGNQCVVTPSMRKLGNGKCAIAIAQRWKWPPENGDKTEMAEELRRLVGKAPEVESVARSAQGASAAVEEFLADRKPS